MSFAIKFVFAIVFVALSSFISRAEAQITARADCEANCTARHPDHGELDWGKQFVTFSGEVVYATVVYIFDEETGETETSTIYNTELPDDVIAPPTNAAGTRIDSWTVETASGEYTTVTLAYPTLVVTPTLDYYWWGILPTTDAFGQSVCSNATAQEEYFKGYTGDVTTTVASLDPKDPFGYYHYLFTGHVNCRGGFEITSVPEGAQTDAALELCTRKLNSTCVAPAAAVTSRSLLTDTSTSTKSKQTKEANAQKQQPEPTPTPTPAPSPTPAPAPTQKPVTKEPEPPKQPEQTPEEDKSSEEKTAQTPTGKTPDAFTTHPPAADQSQDKATPLPAPASLHESNVEGSFIGSASEVAVSDTMAGTPSAGAESGSEGEASPSTTHGIGDAIAGGMGETRTSSPGSSSTTSLEFEGTANALLRFTSRWSVLLSAMALLAYLTV